jgi:hypothetical protein
LLACWHFCDHSWAAAGPLATQSSFEISGAQIFSILPISHKNRKRIESVRIDWFSQLQTISAVNCGGLGGNPWSKRDQEEPLPPAERFSVDNNWRCNMFKSLDIQKDMEVVGLDGKHVGTVDHLETADRIILSKDDPKAGGRHHLISIEWVDYVDQKVHLNKPSMKATKEWQVAA